jgi:hypothetical protein
VGVQHLPYQNNDTARSKSGNTFPVDSGSGLNNLPSSYQTLPQKQSLLQPIVDRHVVAMDTRAPADNGPYNDHIISGGNSTSVPGEMQWCAGSRCDMMSSDEDHDRSRRHSAEDQGWSRTGQVLGGRVILCAVCTVHMEMMSADFLLEPQNHGQVF